MTAPQAYEAVLAVLSGKPLEDVAHSTGIEPQDLDDAVALFQQAGRMALADQDTNRGWFMARVRFHDQSASDQVVHDHLLPLLHAAQDQGLLSQWWFMRKPPGRRLRFLPSSARTRARSATPSATDSVPWHCAITSRAGPPPRTSPRPRPSAESSG
ncbi:lantibiotic dehydratase C-terminal domain-containing protein [Streptomyces sp. NBC_00203]|uniref:lantibiotic dehydratase C-terminal domain-containing protein n=1 Tax=Streptomyces sp. NBC_00203 TaxID=2975680 RepID=UPI0038650247